MASRFFVRFSLRTLLVMMLLIGTTCGVWLGTFSPIQRQWKATEAIFFNDGWVETSPSSFPSWLRWTRLPGQSDNICAVHLDHHPVSDDSIRSLANLPYLKRLYLERCELQSKQIDQIIQLHSLERLAVWGNDLTDEDVVKLSQLKHLQVLDITDNTNLTWRCLLPFKDRPEVKLKHSLVGDPQLREGEAAVFARLKSFAQKLDIVYVVSASANDWQVIWNDFPVLQDIIVRFGPIRDSEFASHFPLTEPPCDRYVDIMTPCHQYLDAADDGLAFRRFLNVWNRIGPHARRIRIKSRYGPELQIELELQQPGWRHKTIVVLVINSNFLQLSKRIDRLKHLSNVSELQLTINDNSPLSVIEKLKQRIRFNNDRLEIDVIDYR